MYLLIYQILLQLVFVSKHINHYTFPILNYKVGIAFSAFPPAYIFPHYVISVFT